MTQTPTEPNPEPEARPEDDPDVIPSSEPDRGPIIVPSDPIERKDPDFDPGLAPDPKHAVEENPPEGAGPARRGGDR